MAILQKKFYSAPTLTLAQKLLGTFLVSHTPKGRTVGRIVETEAYLFNDEACHASRGMTKRTQVMFGPPGVAYIYFIYGMYFCFNVVSGEVGQGEAVLIRALEPVEGIDLMEKRRATKDIKKLCSGPAKLVLALDIEKEQNGQTLTSPELHLLSHDSYGDTYKMPSNDQIVASKRIGISKAIDLEYRFTIKNSLFVSK